MNIKAGTRIPPFEVKSVDPEKMKTMAALLRDPYPIHWDATGNASMGIEGQTVNQGPLNLSYVANMLMNWQGPDCVRRLTASFTGWVLNGDTLIANGEVIEVVNGPTEMVAKCRIWIDRDGKEVLHGEAHVALNQG